MTYARIPDFSVPLLGLPEPEPVPFHSDPILEAIERHEEAWSVYQVAPIGEALRAARAEKADSLDALLATPFATRGGAFALLRHLRWWLGEEAWNAELIGTPYRIAAAREADLTLLLGCDGVSRIPPALPAGRLHAPVSEPAARAGKRVSLVASAGELLAAVVIVAGGAVLTGLATLI